MRLQLVVWAAALVLLLQVAHIEGGQYARCESHSETVQTLIHLPDLDVLSCPSLLSNEQNYCCFDRWQQRDGTYFCCDTATYFFLEIGVVYILPILLLMMLVTVVIWICRCLRCLLCSCCPSSSDGGAVYNTVQYSSSA